MRLIDADELKKQYTQIFVEAYGVKCAEMFQGVINQMPTSYNVDNVIEELEDSHMWLDDMQDNFIILNEAIETVRRGGKNE